MRVDSDALLFATRLVDEVGEAATRISRVKLVELTAANDLRAADFWRQVMQSSESLLARRAGRAPVADAPIDG